MVFLAIVSNLPQMPSLCLIAGVISFSVAVVWTCTGKVWVRFDGWVYRAKEPAGFWFVVAMYYLAGVGLIAFYVRMIN
jgi:hypothetical protein